MRTIGEKNFPGQPGAITDVKRVKDDYVLAANEVEVDAELIRAPLRDRNGYRLIDDAGTVREMTDAERPQAEIQNGIRAVVLWLNPDQAYTAMHAHDALDQSVFVLTGSILVRTEGAPDVVVDARQAYIVPSKTTHALVAGKAGALFVTFHTKG